MTDEVNSKVFKKRTLACKRDKCLYIEMIFAMRPKLQTEFRYLYIFVMFECLDC